MQRFANELVGDVRPVEVAGIDVIDTRRHRFTQNRNGSVTILRRPEDAGSGQLHGAVAQAMHRRGRRSANVLTGVKFGMTRSLVNV